MLRFLEEFPLPQGSKDEVLQLIKETLAWKGSDHVGTEIDLKIKLLDQYIQDVVGRLSG